MSIQTVTKNNIETMIQNNKMVILDFWASWCGPCKTFGPIFDLAAAKHKDVVFGKVDITEETVLTASFGVRSVPTVMMFKEKHLVFSQPGAVSPEALDELIEKVREIDMNEVQKNLKNECAEGGK